MELIASHLHTLFTRRVHNRQLSLGSDASYLTAEMPLPLRRWSTRDAELEFLGRRARDADAVNDRSRLARLAS